MPRVNADAYDVQVADDRDFVEDVIEVIEALPVKYVDGKASRWMDLDPGWLCVTHMKRYGGQLPRWECAIERTFTEELPNRSGPTTGTQPLGLPADGGLGEHVAFIYDETTKLIWLQRDRRVCGKLLLMDYLREMTGVPVAMVTRLRSDSTKRAKGLKRFRGVQFAYLTDKETNPQGGLAKVLKIFGTYGAARIEVRLTPARGDDLGAMAKEIVADLAEEIDEDTGTVPKARVWGRHEIDDEREDIIDLIRDKQLMFRDVKNDRTRSADRLMLTVREIWQHHRTKV